MSLSSRLVVIGIVAAAGLARAQTPEENAAVQKLLERVAAQEQKLVEKLRSRSAVLETYIQELGSDPNALEQGVRDHYFLGRLGLSKELAYVPLVARSDSPKGTRLGFLKGRDSVFLPSGFAQMVMPDGNDFSTRSYRFDYVRREFLGEVRCLVFDVSPVDARAVGKFIGRIWVEDPPHKSRGSAPGPALNPGQVLG